MNVKQFLSYIRYTLFPIIVYGIAIGLATGTIIWAYSLTVEFISEQSANIYAFFRANPVYVPLLFLSLATLAVISYFIILLAPEVTGSGVPYSEGVMRGLLPLRWLIVLPAMILNSFISFIAGIPLGSEGPSILIGSCIGSGSNDIAIKGNRTRLAWKRQSITGGASAAFAVAFNAPLAGIIFALEEIHKRFSPMILLPASASVIVASITANVLTALTGHGISEVIFTEFNMLAEPTFRELPFLALLGLMMGLFSVMFSLLYNTVATGMNKTKIPAWLKILAVFLLTGIAGLFVADSIGSGGNVIRKIALMQLEWQPLLLLLCIKLILVVFCSNGGVTGGLFFPTLAIGAIFGGLTAKLFIAMGMNGDFYNMIVLISMCAFLGGVMRSPITAVVLIIEMTNTLTNDFWATCLVILLAYFIVELFNVEPIYDKLLGTILGKRNAGKKKKLVEYEIEIEENSFAVGRSVRDILWPANALVIKVKETDSQGNIIYRMDKDGERKIHVGDKFVIQAETSDPNEIYKQLCYIVKRPEFFNASPEFDGKND